MRTRDMTYIALMAVVISVCSWLSIPMTISFTMQTFAVFTALLLLGGKRGFHSLGKIRAVISVFGKVFHRFLIFHRL